MIKSDCSHLRMNQTEEKQKHFVKIILQIEETMCPRHFGFMVWLYGSNLVDLNGKNSPMSIAVRERVL